MTQDCERYLEDPEANEAHLATCGSCSAMVRELDAAIATRPVLSRKLPVAAWEGASHRPWGLVAGVVLALLAITFGLFTLAGGSPVDALRQIGGSLPFAMFGPLMKMISGGVRNAPAGWQFGIGIAFLVVNVVLFMLLRRAPRGVDE